MKETKEIRCNTAEKIANWHEMYEQKEQEYLDTISGYLKEGTPEAKKAICSIGEQEGFVDAFKTRNELSYVINAINIFYREEEAKLSPDIFDLADSVDELIAVMNQLRFCMWELEYTDDAQTVELLCDYISENNVSVYMLMHTVEAATINAYYVAMKLANELKKKKMYEYQLYVLLLAVGKCSGDEEALCELATLYASAGNLELARSCLEQIENPAIKTERVREQYGL